MVWGRKLDGTPEVVTTRIRMIRRQLNDAYVRDPLETVL